MSCVGVAENAARGRLSVASRTAGFRDTPYAAGGLAAAHGFVRPAGPVRAPAVLDWGPYSRGTGNPRTASRRTRKRVAGRAGGRGQAVAHDVGL
ncbi:hypothetical protein [Frankia sp. Cj3]|uniref:hypothetical protein n=1 Tax=Frankia sp. Cj3 TaxID=2880976 RepID=UPI001EF68992|nr:hypothetical protein [Frankia sp. Cj3]